MIWILVCLCWIGTIGGFLATIHYTKKAERIRSEMYRNLYR